MNEFTHIDTYKNSLRWDLTRKVYLADRRVLTERLSTLLSDQKVLIFFDDDGIALSEIFSNIAKALLGNSASMIKKQRIDSDQFHCGANTFQNTIRSIKDHKMQRKDIIIACGSKALVDAVQFCADNYRRGMCCIRGYSQHADALNALNQGARVKMTFNQGKSNRTLCSRSNFEENYIFSEQSLIAVDSSLCALPVRTEQFSSEFKVEYHTNLLNKNGSMLSRYLSGRKKVFIICDPYSGNKIEDMQEWTAQHGDDDSKITTMSIRVNEHNKHFDTVLGLIEKLSAEDLQQDDLLVAMGGGVLMDIVGYVASLYSSNGIDYLRIPTTFLGMIDAGIGLKVGVNCMGSKNFIGDYYPPLACLVMPGFLKTLPVEEIRCGLSEAIKIAAVKNHQLFHDIEQHYEVFFHSPDIYEAGKIIKHSVALMLEELEANPFEYELKRLPDFGHEFGHMIESLSRYRIRHGEAVSIGMAIATHLAVQYGCVSEPDYRRMVSLLKDIGLPIFDNCCKPEILYQKIYSDILPHKGGKLFLVVFTSIGDGNFIDDVASVDINMLTASCKRLCATQNSDFTLSEAEMKTTVYR